MSAKSPVLETTASQQRWTLILGALASFLVGLDALVVTTALPTLRHELNSGIEGLSWTINAYELAFAASILTGSTLGDRFGRRRIFIVGIALFTVSSIGCALSTNVEVLIGARIAQGIGGGIAVPLGLALITGSTPAHMRGKALGIWGAFTGLAVAAGPLVGGAIVDGLTWQWIFWLNVPVGIAVIIMTIWKVQESDHVFVKPDLIGLILATIGVFGIAQALISGNAAGWTAASVMIGFIGGGIALLVFLGHERRASNPMIPLQLFRKLSFTVGCLSGFILMAGVFGMGFLTSQYLQLAFHKDPWEVGLGLLPATGLALFISPLTGRIADRIGEKWLIILGLALQAVGLILIGTLVTSTSGYGTILGPLLLTGAGIAIAFPTVTSVVMRSVAPQEISIASGLSNTFRQLGAVFGVAIATAFFAAYGNYQTPHDFIDGSNPAFIALGILSAAGVAISASIKQARPYKDQSGQDHTAQQKITEAMR